MIAVIFEVDGYPPPPHIPCLTEYPGCLPMWLGPHPQPDGQLGAHGGVVDPGQPVRPSHGGGRQHEGGAHHRLLGRLQGQAEEGS